MSPRWLRQDDRDPVSWEQHQDERLENLFGALAETLGDRVQERMAAVAGCSLLGVAALQWLDRGRGWRTCDLREVLGISMPGASQLVDSLVAAGLVQRVRYAHDQRERRLCLTELGVHRTFQARYARATLIRDLVSALPFPWRLRLIRILEKLLARMAESRAAVIRLCRHCDWDVCRRFAIEPCPVAIAYAERTTSSQRG